MNIKVVRVEERVDKWGTKKILHTEDGKQYKISEKSFAYDNVKGEGPYDVTMGEYQGHPFVKTLKFLGVYKDTPTATKPQSGAISADRIGFEKDKQTEIKLECYAGIAKDIALHNAAIAKAEVKIKEVMNLAKDMMIMHNDIIELAKKNALGLQGESFDKELKEVFPDASVEDYEIPA